MQRRSLIITLCAFAILALPFMIRPYVVTGVSMEPTFVQGESLLVENISPRIFGLSRGSVIVFKDPRHPEHPIILKRVVGLPNETVRVSNEAITIVYPDEQEKVFGADTEVGREHNGAPMETKLGPEDYFLLGDNRDQSEDSRHWGTIQLHEMIGRPVLRVWPLSRFGFFPG